MRIPVATGITARLGGFRSRFIAGLLLVAWCGSAVGQAFTENFDNITTLPGNGWVTLNNSNPVGLMANWFQGTPVSGGGPFDAYNGAANAYIAANFNFTSGANTINGWMLTPNRTLRNGDVLTFYTRKYGVGQDYPDRLEVRLSTNGASTNVGAPGSNVGDFTTLLMAVNPTLVVGGYPYVWTMYTITVSGLPAPTSGRMAFRYFVTNGGPSGANSDYIGIDNVVYTPYVCPAFTMTAGGALAGGSWGQAYSTTLSQTGALGTPNFAVVAGALPAGLTLSASGTISGTPSATGTFNFTAQVNDASGCSGSQSYSITVVPSLPAAPTDVTATAGDTEAFVSFTAPSSDGGTPITGYSASCTDGTTSTGGTGATSPITVSGLVNGTAYTCTAAAINSVGTGPDSSPSNSITPIGNQTIAFAAQAGQTYSPGGTFAIDPPATASSGLAVTYGSSTPGTCTVAGSTVSIVAAGSCTLTADQAGDAAWTAAPQATQTLTIAKASQTLALPAQTVASRWFYPGDTFAIDPEATSATPNAGAPIVYSSLDAGVCTVGGTTVTMVGAGACLIAANQAGDDNFLAAAQVAEQVDLAVPTEADLWVDNDADTATARIGDTVAYTIVVGNDGPADASDVVVLDSPPARLEPGSVVWQCTAAVGADCPSPDSDSGGLDVTIAALPRDATVTFELLGVVREAADPGQDFTAFDNTASVALPVGAGLADPDGNNTSSASVLVIPFGVFADGFEQPQP